MGVVGHWSIAWRSSHSSAYHYGRHWLPLVPNALGEGPDALGKGFPATSSRERRLPREPKTLHSGKAFPRAVLALGEELTPLVTSRRHFLLFLKKILLRVQHSGKPSSPSAAAQALGEDTLFPECCSPYTRGSHSENLFFCFLLFHVNIYIYINHKSTVIYHKPHLYITNDQICMKSTIYYKSHIQKYTLFQVHKFNT